jgi:ABC-type Fe3+-citrate transport system substrate-binding protein
VKTRKKLEKLEEAISDLKEDLKAKNERIIIMMSEAEEMKIQ